MQFTDQVKQFFTKLCTTPTINKMGLTDLIEDDIIIFDDDVTDRILRGRMQLECNWASYILSDIDIYYDENPLDINNRLDIFGIRDLAPTLRSRDTGITIVYRFTTTDMFGGLIDVVTGFRITIKQSNGVIRTRRILVYG